MCLEMGYLNLEIDELQMSMAHQGCFDLDVGKLRLDFHGDGGVLARTSTLKLGSAKGTRYIVYNAYQSSMMSHLFIVGIR